MSDTNVTPRKATPLVYFKISSRYLIILNILEIVFGMMNKKKWKWYVFINFNGKPFEILSITLN